MPFTAAHTVAVLPLMRSQRLSASALVVGSMSPDFEYFIRMGTTGEWGHNLPGIILFDLPITFVAVVLFHTIVKHNLLNNLPKFLQERFADIRQMTVKTDIFSRPLSFAICACIGAATHLIWDGFTHDDGFFVNALPGIYVGTFVPFEGVNYPLWYGLQHISSWVGLTILAVYIFYMKPKATVTRKPGFGYWFALVAMAAVTVFIRFQFPSKPGWDTPVISTISGFCIGLIVLGLLPEGNKNTH